MKKAGIICSGNVWFSRQGRHFIGRGRVELLELIDKHGSITQAAKAMGMTYKAAWDAVEAMNALAKSPLVSCSTGGRGGGGTTITEYGKHLISSYRNIEKSCRDYLAGFGEEFDLDVNVGSPSP